MQAPGEKSAVGDPAWGGLRTLTLDPSVLQMHHFPDLLGRLVSTNLFYFKSSWDDVRAAAPMFTGKQTLLLLLHLTSSLYTTQLYPTCFRVPAVACRA